jgi:rhomboid protease GluP
MAEPPRTGISPTDVLAWCAAEAVWYPSVAAASRNVPRDDLYAPTLDLLSLGLIEVVDWSKDKRQGYALTDLGKTKVGRPLPLPTPEVTVRSGRSETAFQRGERVRIAFLDPPPSLVGQLLTVICVLWFVVGAWMANKADALPTYLASGHTDTLVKLGGAWSYPLAAGEWWRLGTANVVHGNLIHLLLNMLTLASVAPAAEALFGRWRLAAIVVLSGVGGAAASAAFRPDAMGVGASGAICGVLAACVVGFLVDRRHLEGADLAGIGRPFAIAVAMAVAVSFVPGVDWIGHLTGAAVGFLAAALLDRIRPGAGWDAWTAAITLVLIVAGCTTGFRWHIRTAASWAQARLWGDVQRALRQARIDWPLLQPAMSAAAAVPPQRAATLHANGTMAAVGNSRRRMDAVAEEADRLLADVRTAITAFEAVPPAPERERTVAESLGYFRSLETFALAAKERAAGPVSAKAWTDLKPLLTDAVKSAPKP